MRLYRFSPITDERACLSALRYIHEKMIELSELAMGKEFPTYTLKIFAHYDNEYDFLFKWVNEMGLKGEESSPTSYYVKPRSPLKINGETIEYLGIRRPDPYRTQVGCGDFLIKDFAAFKNKYLDKSAFMREIQHPKYEMLELFHPDIDVLGYAVKE